jgi:multidrug efflux pump
MPLTFGINVDLLNRAITVGAPSSQWWVQLSQAIVYGLGFATVLTLVLTPCALMLRENVGAWWARRRGPARDEQPAQRSESLPKAAE